jgi:hypothetical protein
VRFSHVFEPTGGQQDDWDEQFERWGLRLTAETIGLIVERQGYLKGHLAARHWRVPYAIRRLGMFTEQEAQNVASALCDQKSTGQRGFAVAKLLVGTTDLRRQSLSLSPPRYDAKSIRRRMEKYEILRWSDRMFFDGDLIQFLAWRGRRNL